MKREKTFADKKVEMNESCTLRMYPENVERLTKLFADKSFAVVDDKFVPIIPRHMTNTNWRDLFWLQPQTLVILGKKHKSLCSICRQAIPCLSKGMGRKYDFKCRASPQTLFVPLTNRKKGEP